MLRTVATLVLCAAMGLSALPVSAADNGVYLGAGVAQSKVDYENDADRFDGDDTKFKIIAGVRPLDWLAVEVNYIDFGKIEDSFAEQELKGIDAFLVGLLEVGLVDFYAKAGVVRWDQDINFRSALRSDQSETGYDPAYGGGLQFHFGSISVRGEYERFAIGDDTDVDLISLGLTWTFL
jgi:Outer membrane protein beta-barrel domain